MEIHPGFGLVISGLCGKAARSEFKKARRLGICNLLDGAPPMRRKRMCGKLSCEVELLLQPPNVQIYFAFPLSPAHAAGGCSLNWVPNILQKLVLS